MPLDVKKLLHATAYRKLDMDRLLDPDCPSFLRFDPELGYVFIDHVLRDGTDNSLSAYTYEPNGGHRKLIHCADQPCRINTFGNSFTQCQQVSDGETWQEVLAAHIREPIRNFGVGGYSVYQAYQRARRAEAEGVSAEYIVLNIWDEDHVRNLDACRWIRSCWIRTKQLRALGDEPWLIHGFPWSHLRYDLDKGDFVELPGLCKDEDDLSKLADRDYFYEFFKHDPIVHLFVLTYGGDAPIDHAEALAEAFGLKVDLRDPEKRAADAKKLHLTYGINSTKFLLDKMREWTDQHGKKLMVLLSYGPPAVRDMLEKDRRPDQKLVDYLESNNVPHVDCLLKTAEDYKAYNVSANDYMGRFYIAPAGAAVFGHYAPYGNHWFAFSIKNEIVNWLDPKPPAYREEGATL